MDSTVISIFLNSLIFLTGAILNFIFNNPIAGWILLGLFGLLVCLELFCIRNIKKISNMTREEAIKEIKSWAIPSERGREALETLIPELAESEEREENKRKEDELPRFYGD